MQISDLKDILDTYEDIALSDSDMIDLMDGKAKIVVYPDILKYNTIEELLDPYNITFILYEEKPHYGHWTVLFRHDRHNKKPVIEFFNSYGDMDGPESGMPDYLLRFIPEPFRTNSNQNIAWLSKLLYDVFDDYELIYNEFQFQKLNSKIKTCGRWCCLRAMLKDLPLRQFKDLFLDLYSDKLATLLTAQEDQIKDSR